MRPIRSRHRDSENARDEASDGGVRRARRLNLLNDCATYRNEVGQIGYGDIGRDTAIPYDWRNIEDGVESANKQAILCICEIGLTDTDHAEQ